MPRFEIKHHTRDCVLYSADAETLRSVVQQAVAERKSLSGADLRGADLRDANLREADLNGADLSGADLRDADLSFADLRDADLRDTDLRDTDLSWSNLYGAYLGDADLSGAKIHWCSHGLVAELLRRAAGQDVTRRKIAGLVAISPDWDWPEFLRIDDPLRDWALDTLAPYVRDGDNAPKELRKRAKQLKPTAATVTETAERDQ